MKNNIEEVIITEDCFGFLYKPFTFTIEDIKIFPIDNYQKIEKEWIGEYKNIDNHVYPPITWQEEGDIDECGKIIAKKNHERKKIPNTERPAFLHRLPRSHKIILNKEENRRKFRLGLGRFLLQCISFIFGTRLHFYDWWTFDRVPLFSTVNLIVKEKESNLFLNRAINKWNNLNDENKKRISNLIFLHTISGAKELEKYFEKFILEYMIMDGIRRIVQDDFPKQDKISDSDKIYLLAEMYKLTKNEKCFK